MSTELAFKLEEKDVTEKALSLVDQASMVKVTDAESYRCANFLREIISEAINEVEETFNPICDAANKAHKEATSKRSKYLDPLKAAYKEVKRLMGVWDDEQNRLRLAEQKRLEEIARKEEEERRLLDAIEAEEEAKANGATAQEAAQEAEDIISQPVYVTPVVLPKETPKVKGLSFRTIWKFRITDINKIPREYLMADQIKIGGVVRALKQQCNIPGITVYEERC